MLDIGMTQEELREVVINRAAEKLADDSADDEALALRASKLIDVRVAEIIAARVEGGVEQILNAHLEKAMSAPLQAVNVFGEKVGSPTSIRDTLAERARDFWNTKVDANGKPAGSGYYDQERAKTRAEWMLGKAVSEQFMAEVKQNAVSILAVFKERLRADGHAALDKHLDELVRVKAR